MIISFLIWMFGGFSNEVWKGDFESYSRYCLLMTVWACMESLIYAILVMGWFAIC